MSEFCALFCYRQNQEYSSGALISLLYLLVLECQSDKVKPIYGVKNESPLPDEAGFIIPEPQPESN
ncbi:MAG: DUF1496 domain-containing protein [Balneolaceae bacterium]|nr:DUF1496 domain-containing protein [Balneolaceae bacterium]